MCVPVGSSGEEGKGMVPEARRRDGWQGEAQGRGTLRLQWLLGGRPLVSLDASGSW